MTLDKILSFLKKHYGEPDYTFELNVSQDVSTVYILLYLPIPDEGIHSSLLITAGFSCSRSKDKLNDFECIFEVSGVLKKEEYKKIGEDLIQHINTDKAFLLHSIYKRLNLDYNNKFKGSIVLNYGKHDSYFWDVKPDLQAFEIIPLYQEELEALSYQPKEIRNALIIRSSKIDWNNWKRPKNDIIKEAINGVWVFIANWYEKNSKRIFSQLKEEANQKSIDNLNGVLGVSLPKDFAISLMNYNGEIEFHDYKYLSTKEIAKTWIMMKEILNSNSFPNQLRDNRKIKEIKEVWWHEKWIPFGKDSSGNLMCLDMSPTSSGVVGQVIYWEKSEGPILTQYRSFFHWLFAYEQGLYNGYYKVDKDGFIYH